MNSTKAPYKKENKIPRALSYSTIAVTLLLVGACSFTTELADDSVSPELSIRGLQSDATEVNVRITGEDYQRSTTVTPSDSRLEFFLPPGKDVKFEVEAANQNSDTDHVYSWGMTRYADLVEGEDTEIDFTMGPKETKIIIPDHVTYPETLVQVSNLDVSEDVDSLSTDQWNTVELVDTEYPPYDTALDNQGRIWTSYFNSYSYYSPISMINNITSGEPDYTASDAYGSAIAFDRMNSYLYYIGDGSTTIGRIKITPDIADIGDPETFDVSQESEIVSLSLFGMAVDHAGNLYFAGGNQFEQPTIFKYDPQRTSGNRVVATYSNQDVIPNNSSMDNMDLLVKNKHLYITNPDGPSGSAILKLTRDLQYVDSFGRVVDFASGKTADKPGEFYGPTRFLATTDENIYLTDDNAEYVDSMTVESPNRIIRFKDIEGADWKAYRPTGTEGDDELELFFPIPS